MESTKDDPNKPLKLPTSQKWKEMTGRQSSDRIREIIIRFQLNKRCLRSNEKHRRIYFIIFVISQQDQHVEEQ